MIAGLKMTCSRETVGKVGIENEKDSDAGRNEKREDDEAEDSSMRFLKVMIESMAPSWNRSTMSICMSESRLST